MARPTGRYFASVIAKIREAKVRETIIIDEDFKMRLRQQLMMKMTAEVKPERISWMRRLAPFRVYFSAVPALVLVIVAVVGLSRLPLPNVAPNSIQSATKNVEPATQAAPQTEFVAAGIKTFPGSMVLPPDYFQKNQAVLNVAPIVVPKVLQTSGFVPVPNPVPAVAPTLSPREPQPAKMGANISVPVSTTVSQPPAAVVVSPRPLQPVNFFGLFQSQPQPVVQPVQPQVMVPSPPVQLPLLLPPPPVQLSVQPNIKPVLPVVNPPAPAPAPVPTPAPTPAPTPTPAPVPVMRTRSSTSNNVQTDVPALPTLNEMAVLPAQNLYSQVIYNGNFSSDERTILEKNVLPRLAEGKDVGFIRVFQNDAANVVVELNYSNGQAETFHYSLGDSLTTTVVSPALSQAALRVQR